MKHIIAGELEENHAYVSNVYHRLLQNYIQIMFIRKGRLKKLYNNQGKYCFSHMLYFELIAFHQAPPIYNRDASDDMGSVQCL